MATQGKVLDFYIKVLQLILSRRKYDWILFWKALLPKAVPSAIEQWWKWPYDNNPFSSHWSIQKNYRLVNNQLAVGTEKMFYFFVTNQPGYSAQKPNWS